MAGKSNIEWTGHTWNPLAGCTVLTPGCTHCYAMKMAARLERMGQELYAGLTKPSKAGPVWTGVMRQAPRHVLLAPLRRRRATTYFVNSMSDLFHEQVPDQWIDQIFAVMALCPQHTFQVLTKRAERMRVYMSDPEQKRRALIARDDVIQEVGTGKYPAKEMVASGGRLFAGALPNVWLGVSTERQKEADERIPSLLQTPAALRFISAEPLLGPIDLISTLARFQDTRNNRCAVRLGDQLINWVIAGAESGHGARDCDLEWVRALKDQCVAAGLPFFFKQHAKNGRKIPTPELDGRTWTEMPRIAA